MDTFRHLTHAQTIGSSIGDESRKPIDLLFVVDKRESQSHNMHSCIQLIQRIFTYTKPLTGDLRLGLIAYRKELNADTLLVNVPFASDVNQLTDALKSSVSSKAGTTSSADDEEPVSTALKQALEHGWRDESNKIVILLMQGFPSTLDSSGQDTLRQMIEKGLILRIRCFAAGKLEKLDVRALLTNTSHEVDINILASKLSADPTIPFLTLMDKAEGLYNAVAAAPKLAQKVSDDIGQAAHGVLGWFGRKKGLEPGTSGDTSQDYDIPKVKKEEGTPVQRIDSVAKTAAAAHIIKEMTSSLTSTAVSSQAASAPIDTTKPARLVRPQLPVPAKFVPTVKVGEEDIDLEQTRRIVLQSLMRFALDQ